MSMETAIRFENIEVIKGEIILFEDLNISFPKGKSTVIMGPSGCGKSTMLKLAAGILLPDRGNVLIEGKPLLKFSEKELMEFRKHNGFVFQDAALWANKSIFQNLALPLEFHFRHLHSNEVRRRVEKMLATIGFRDDPNLRPAQLSAGECKMASFARALITDPSVIFMDSPLISIDSEVIDRIIRLIQDIKKEGKTILISTHDPRLTSLVADELVVLKKGAVLESGEFDNVVRSTDKEVITVLTDVLSKASTFDGDILELLDTDREKDS